jgi:hypothetical protein
MYEPSTFITYGSNNFLIININQWVEFGVNDVPWSWFRDICEEAERRGLIRIIRSGSNDPFWWRMSEMPFEILFKAERH